MMDALRSVVHSTAKIIRVRDVTKLAADNLNGTRCVLEEWHICFESGEEGNLDRRAYISVVLLWRSDNPVLEVTASNR
jgi:hypothetical protein